RLPESQGSPHFALNLLEANSRRISAGASPMRHIRMLGGVLIPALLACGCSTMNNTERGAGAGGLIGAGTGALIGSATGPTAGGALIGAGVGAVSGGRIGNAIDKSEQKTAAIAAANSQPRGPLGITDVAQMARAHVTDQVIISQIRSTGSVFR